MPLRDVPFVPIKIFYIYIINFGQKYHMPFRDVPVVPIKFFYIYIIYFGQK